MKTQSGFTLVELLVVIIILGILSATALPKFLDLSTDAEQALTDTTADLVTSWGQSNFAAKKLGKSTAKEIKDSDLACTDTADSLAQHASSVFSGGDVSLVSAAPANKNQFQILAPTGSTDDDCGKDKVVQCRIQHINGTIGIAYLPCTN